MRRKPNITKKTKEQCAGSIFVDFLGPKNMVYFDLLLVGRNSKVISDMNCFSIQNIHLPSVLLFSRTDPVERVGLLWLRTLRHAKTCSLLCCHLRSHLLSPGLSCGIS